MSNVLDDLHRELDGELDRLGDAGDELRESAKRVANLAVQVAGMKAMGVETEAAETALASAWSSIRTRASLEVARSIRSAIERGLQTAMNTALRLIALA